MKNYQPKNKKQNLIFTIFTFLFVFSINSQEKEEKK